jgi:Sulfotransferase family
LTPPFPFIVGYGRSGTTLLRAMLDAHREVAIPDESHFVVPMLSLRRRYERTDGFDVDRFTADLMAHFGFRGWGLPPEEAMAAFRAEPPRSVPEGLRAAYRLYAMHHGKPRYGDKTPIHVLHVPLLARGFPEARFVHLIRDGRDVACSYKDQSFGPRNVVEAAIRWKRAVRRGRAAGLRLGPGRYLELRYEALVSDAEASLREVCGVADLAFDPKMLRYFEDHRVASERPHYRNVARPPTPGLRDWRREMAPADVAAFEAIAGGLLEEFGYRRGAPHLSPGDRARAAARWTGVQARRAAARLGKSARGKARLSTSPGTRMPAGGPGPR